MNKHLFTVSLVTLSLILMALIVENQSLHTKANKVAMELNYLEGLKIQVVVADHNDCKVYENKTWVYVTKKTIRDTNHQQLKDLITHEAGDCR